MPATAVSVTTRSVMTISVMTNVDAFRKVNVDARDSCVPVLVTKHKSVHSKAGLHAAHAVMPFSATFVHVHPKKL